MQVLVQLKDMGPFSHSADVTGITNFTADNLNVWTFLSNENEANSRIRITKWLREGLLNSLQCTN